MNATHKHNSKAHQHISSRNLLLLAIALLFSFAIIEALSGWYANSLTLLSDAGHMVADGLSLILAVIAGWVASKPPSPKHSYGLGRAEVLGAWISSLLMVLTAIYIAYEAFERFATPKQVSSTTVLIIASLGIVLNLVLAWILSHAEQTLNLRAAVLHILGDLLGSIAALISGAVIYFTGWMLIDPLLSLFIALLILISSFRLLRETLLVLMEGVPLHLDFAEVGKAMAKVPYVSAVHDLHIWTLSSGVIVLTAHIELNEMENWPKVLTELQLLLPEKFGITHLTLQPESHNQILCPIPITR
jgi:cobalt-zinc-cadmium efflux system protein